MPKNEHQLKAEAMLLELKEAKNWKWFWPVIGLSVYWSSRADIFKKHHVVVERVGEINSVIDKDYRLIENQTADFYVWKEYYQIFSFYRKLFIYTLGIIFLGVIIFLAIFNFLPFIEKILWKRALKNS